MVCGQWTHTWAFWIIQGFKNSIVFYKYRS